MTTLTAPRTVADLLAVAREVCNGDCAVAIQSGRYRFRFGNGWVVSVCFRHTCACDNHGALLSLAEDMMLARSPLLFNAIWQESTTAEVMVIKPDGNRMTWPDNEDGILGFEPVERVAALIRLVAREGSV
jgi:hypothetical protein